MLFSLGWKGLSGTNTLSYQTYFKLGRKRIAVTAAPDAVPIFDTIEMALGVIFTTFHCFSKLTSEPNKLGYYIKLGWKGLPRKFASAYMAYS